MSALVAIPPREADAVAREPEHHRRAREVCGNLGRGCHGHTLTANAVRVAPNSFRKFGGVGR